MRRPRATLADIQRGRSKEFGVPATEIIIRHQLDLIGSFIADYSSGIWFEEVLQELIKYSYANKTKFDIVAAMGVCELADEELQGVVPKKTNVYKETWKDIGWYTDEKGYKKYGVIDTKQNTPKYELFPDNDEMWYKTSNPRYN